jgi:hypothetical protein
MPTKDLVLARAVVRAMQDVHFVDDEDKEWTLCRVKICPNLGDQFMPLVESGRPRKITCQRCLQRADDHKQGIVKIARPKGKKDDQKSSADLRWSDRNQVIKGRVLPPQNIGGHGDIYENLTTGYRYRKICNVWVLIDKGDGTGKGSILP